MGYTWYDLIYRYLEPCQVAQVRIQLSTWLRPGLVASSTSVGHHSLRWHARRQLLGSPSRQASPDARPSGQWPELALITVLTTTAPDSPPLRAILHIDPCQVSHGIQLPDRIWQASSHACHGLIRPECGSAPATLWARVTLPSPGSSWSARPPCTRRSSARAGPGWRSSTVPERAEPPGYRRAPHRGPTWLAEPRLSWQPTRRDRWPGASSCSGRAPQKGPSWQRPWRSSPRRRRCTGGRTRTARPRSA